MSLLPLIGFEFIIIFQRLITPLSDKARVPIPDQIEEVVVQSVGAGADLELLFDARTAQHVYYITGFFCNAGAKEAERRTKNTDIGAYI